MILHGSSPASEATRRSDEATWEAGEAVTGVENQEDDPYQVECVQQEQEEILAMVGLKLIEEPFKLLPVRWVGGRRPIKWKKYPDNYQDAEQEDREEAELHRMTDLLANGRLHIVFIQPSVQAVVEVVRGDHEETQQENEGVTGVVGVPADKNS